MLGTKLQYKRPVPRWRSVTAWAVGVLVAAVLTVALPSRAGAPWFAVVPGFVLTVPIGWALAWVFLVGPFVAGTPRHPEDTVERTWFERARASAFTDLVLLAGLGLVVAVVLGAPASTQAVLVVVLVVGWGDALVRNALTARRGR